MDKIKDLMIKLYNKDLNLKQKELLLDTIAVFLNIYNKEV